MSKEPLILIAEDDAFFRSLLSSMLSGKNMLFAKHGKEAVEKFKSDHPDVVFLDINMPVMDGLAALEEIMKFNPGAFVVMVTGDTHEKVVNRAMELGARGYITKPYSKVQIERYITRYLASWHKKMPQED